MKKFVGEVETINHKFEYVFKDDGSVELQIAICKETGKETRHKSVRKVVAKTKNKDDETEYYILRVTSYNKMEKKLENVREL